jgi:hypothetical protein
MGFIDQGRCAVGLSVGANGEAVRGDKIRESLSRLRRRDARAPYLFDDFGFQRMSWRRGLIHDAVPPCLNFGSLAMLEAIRRASSRVNRFAAARRPDSSSK